MSAIPITANQFEELLGGEKPLLVNFCAPRCWYCRRLAPVYDMIAEAFASSLVAATVNTDEEDMLTEREQIEAIPTLVLYHKGKALDSLVAPQSREKIEKFLGEFSIRPQPCTE